MIKMWITDRRVWDFGSDFGKTFQMQMGEFLTGSLYRLLNRSTVNGPSRTVGLLFSVR